MKKIIYFMVPALMLLSCSNSGYSKKEIENLLKVKQPTLANQNDSVNFALGVTNGAQIKMYFLQNDSTNEAAAEFIDVLDESFNAPEPTEAQKIGKSIGMSIHSFEKEGLAENKDWAVNEKMLFQGLINGIYGDTIAMKSETAKQFFQGAYMASQMDTVEQELGKAVTSKCMTKVKAVTLKSLNDSLNYAFGLMNGDDVARYLNGQDSTGNWKKEFVDAVNAGLKVHVVNAQLRQTAEQIGNSIRQQASQGLIGVAELQTIFPLIKQGFINGIMGDTAIFTLSSANEYVEATINHIKYGDSKGNGERFLSANAQKEGVTVTQSGLQYEVIRMGKGQKPAATDRVKVHYHGTLIDGTVFDSSVDRGEPITFALNQVIPGWTEGVQLMPEGSKFRFYIPQELAYGSRATGSIPPYSALIFEVELIKVNPKE